MNENREHPQIKKHPSHIAYMVLSILFIVASLCLIISWRKERSAAGKAETAVESQKASTGVNFIEDTYERLLPEDDGLAAEVVESELRDMGFLVTQKYLFKEVAAQKDNEGFFGLKAGIFEKRFLISYRGEISAGIDFTRTRVEVDKLAKRLTIKLPGAELYGKAVIDADSFEVYDEKESAFNRFDFEDYNTGLQKVQENAALEALDNGILTAAEQNAEVVVKNFLNAVPGTKDYTVIVEISR